jgi:hypothetical protein
MRTLLGRTRFVLAVGPAVLLLAACSDTSSPTSSEAVVARVTATSASAAEQGSTSMTIRGIVVDSDNRRLAGITIECLGDVTCRSGDGDLIAEGHDHRIETTDADGTFEIFADGAPQATGSFLVNANGRGYHVRWLQVQWPSPTCTADRCATDLHFELTAIAD